MFFDILSAIVVMFSGRSAGIVYVSRFPVKFRRANPVGPARKGRPGRARWIGIAGSLRSARIAGLAIVGLLTACAGSPVIQGAGLSSYDAMTPSNGLVTKSQVNVKKDEVLAAKTVTVLPTAFLPTAGTELSEKQRALVANAVDRALCITLSDRFEVVAPDEAADLTVVATVTHAKETNNLAAGVSAAAMIGMNFVDLGVPVPTPRLPIGLGNLSVEAEAIDPSGRQVAAMVWGKGATMFTSPKVSRAGDAHGLAKAFGDDFGKLLVEGQSPRDKKGIDIDLPSRDNIKSAMGGAPKYAPCESFGRAPGVKGLIGGQLGLPPEWTDKGAANTAPEE